MKVLPQESKTTEKYTIPEFLNKSKGLITDLKRLKPADLISIMKISDKLATINYDRYHNWNKEHTTENSSQAAFSFVGEAYRGLDAASLTTSQLDSLQNSLRILSGLYGVLKPLDLIQAYRLEMGTRNSFRGKKNLYEYWKTNNTRAISKAVEQSVGENVLVNVASKEYFASIDFKKFKHKVIVPSFYDDVNGDYKMVMVFAKRARGMMARFIAENNIEKVEDIKAFNARGYFYDSKKSTDENWVFVR